MLARVPRLFEILLVLACFGALTAPAFAVPSEVTVEAIGYGTVNGYTAPPDNDHYLAATALNAAGSEMPRDTVTSPTTDTTEATLQADLLNPPSRGGPPEPDACGETPLGRTVWYRFFPDVDGRVKLQAVGFDATLALVPFTSVAAPLPQGYNCANLRDDTIETLEEPIEAGAGYAVQVGGATGAGGVLQVSFTFLPDRDGDGVTDEEDRCPRRPGTDSGCPPTIHAGVAYKYDSAPSGARFRYLDVRGAPRGARVDVRCSRGCRRQRLKVRSRVTHIKSFRGRFMPAGARIELRITKRRHIGAYREFTVSAGDVRTSEGCLQPGSKVPRRSCN
jgi:hypothetical protein